MQTLEQIRDQLAAALPQARIEIVPNDCPANQPSLLVDPDNAKRAAQFLRDTPELRFDFCSNATGVDWLERKLQEKIKIKKTVDGIEKEVEETTQRVIPGYLEAVYHLYSMELKHGPIVLRQRTEGRAAGAPLASLTPVWRSCEFQEREIFDLYGIHFSGHPDQRRLLMWEGFEAHPMRKDYVEPDDYEYEPTPHDAVFERAKTHYAP